tara:strand:- start:127 stop:369 length:243 start_codon:yes stop_codon:yes gene_type:complete
MNYIKSIFCYLALSLSVLISSDNLSTTQQLKNSKTVVSEVFSSNEIGKKKKGKKKKMRKGKKKKSRYQAVPIMNRPGSRS